MAEQHELLPFVRHPLYAFKCRHRIKDFATEVMMRSEEVVVSDPESKIKTGIFKTVITTSGAIGCLECAVEPFDQLLERPELGGDFIVIGKADDLSDVEPEVLAIFEIELHGSKRICAVSIGNESETFRELISEMLQSLPHGEDACTNAAAIRASVSEYGTLHGIHDEPDITFDAPDLDVGLICGEVAGRLVIVVIYEGLDENSSSFAIIGDLLMRDPDAVNVPQNVFGTPERYLVVDVVCETQSDDLHGELVEPEGRRVLRK